MAEASGFTLTQERALAIFPKVSSTISIPCSIFLINEVYTDHKTGGTNCIQRVLVGMSIIDILASSAWFLSTWAVPEGSFAYAAGNKASCNFQGFLLQLAIGAPLYNSSLAIFYTLMIKRRWTDDQLRRIERAVHISILTFTIGTSILLLILEQYNHVGAVCWVIGDPPDCGNSSYQASDIPCERGDHAWAWGLALFYGPLWICVIACCSSMVVLCQEVKTTIRRSRRYTTALGATHSLNRSGQNSSRVATQAILYSLTFLITWMPSTLWSIAHWFQWKHYGLDIAAAIAEPLQGMWNLMIFLRTRPGSVRKIQSTLAYLCPLCCEAPEEVTATSEGASRLSLSPSVKNLVQIFGPLRMVSTRRTRFDPSQIEDLHLEASPCEVSRLGFSSLGSEMGELTGLEESARRQSKQSLEQSDTALDIDVFMDDSSSEDATIDNDGEVDTASKMLDQRQSGDAPYNSEEGPDVRNGLNPQHKPNDKVDSWADEKDMITMDAERRQSTCGSILSHPSCGEGGDGEREVQIEMIGLSSTCNQSIQGGKQTDEPTAESQTETTTADSKHPASPQKRRVSFPAVQAVQPNHLLPLVPRRHSMPEHVFGTRSVFEI